MSIPLAAIEDAVCDGALSEEVLAPAPFIKVLYSPSCAGAAVTRVPLAIMLDRKNVELLPTEIFDDQPTIGTLAKNEY
jgi:hypothetical protein